MATSGAAARRLPQTTDATTAAAKVDEATKAGVAAANAAGQASFRALLQQVVDTLTRGYTGEEPSPAGFATADAYMAAAATARRFIIAAARHDSDAAQVQASAVAAGMQEPLAADLARAAVARRTEIQDSLTASVPHAPTMKSLRWRVDVNISSATTARVLRPSVILEMTLSDGSIRTFEVPMDAFHQLRYNVAKVLTSMSAVEAHPVFKIA